MDFETRMEYTKEQEDFRGEVRAWLAVNMPKFPEVEPWQVLTREEYLERARLTKEFRLKMGEKGWRAPRWPKEWGGGSLTPEETVVLNEELRGAQAPNISDLGLTKEHQARPIYLVP